MCTYVASKVRFTRVVFCLKKQENSEGERVIEFDCSSMRFNRRLNQVNERSESGLRTLGAYA